MDKIISSAVKEAFGNLIENTQYPIFILFLELPHEAIDINVHPRKEYISFINASLIHESIKSVIQKTLAEHNLTFSNISFQSSSTRLGTTTTFAANVLKDEVVPWSFKDQLEILDGTFIIQLHNTYLLVQTKKGLLLIDQHAAHERILYEQFRKEFNTRKKKYVPLSKPLIIELSLPEIDILEENNKVIYSHGFEIEKFKDNLYRVTSVPELLKDRNIELHIQELLSELSQENPPSEIDIISNVMISFLACRGAVMKGEKLTKKEAQRLIERLQSTNNNTTCPHGRPTQIEISIEELHRMFKRK